MSYCELREATMRASLELQNVGSLLAFVYVILMTAATGQHQGRGQTKEKTQKLDELKARRKEKSEKKRVRWFLNVSEQAAAHANVLRQESAPRKETAHPLPWTWRCRQRKMRMVKLPSKSNGTNAQLGYLTFRNLTRMRPNCKTSNELDFLEMRL